MTVCISCGALPFTKELKRENQITHRAFFSNLKDSLNNSDACKCESESVSLLAFLLSDGMKEVYEMFTANGMSANAHVYHGTSSMVIGALFQCFLTEIVLQEAHESVIRASRHQEIITAMENATTTFVA